MENLLRDISDKFMVFHSFAWGQVELEHYKTGMIMAAKSRTASMELGELLEQWRKVSVEHQADNVDLPHGDINET